MQNVKIQSTCHACGAALGISCAIDPLTCASEVKGGLTPSANAFIYQITSDQIEQFVQAKARQFVPDIKVVCTPITPKEPKNPYSKDRKRYAFLKIAFNDSALGNKDSSWFEKIGESGTRLVPNLFKHVVEQYRYDIKAVDEWLKNYRYLEYLETFFGITSAMLEDIKSTCIPNSIKDNMGREWIMFSAAPEKIIHDMLSTVNTNHPDGKMEITDIQIIAKGQISYTVYVYPNEMPVVENNHVRSLLMGDKK